MSRFFAGVGSRDTPEHAMRTMERIAKALCDRGWGLSSGHADGADQAFYRGMQKSARFAEVPNRIFLPFDGFNGRYHEPRAGFYDATRFTGHYEQAKEMAKRARGSFHGLGENGIAMHTRNVFQIHGGFLDTPVAALFYWAPTVGKKEKVKGGTNTALQLAIEAGIEKRYNLYKMTDGAKVLLMLDELEDPVLGAL